MGVIISKYSPAALLLCAAVAPGPAVVHGFLPPSLRHTEPCRRSAAHAMIPVDDASTERLAPPDLPAELIDSSYAKGATDESRAAGSGSNENVPFASEEAGAVDNYPPFNEPGNPLRGSDAAANNFFGRLIDGAPAGALGSFAADARARLTTTAPEAGYPSWSSDALRKQMSTSQNDIAWGAEDGRFGLPVPRQRGEAWRTWNLGEWVNGPTYAGGCPDGAVLALDGDGTARTEAALRAAGVDANDADTHEARLVYVDGRYCPALSRPSGVCFSAHGDGEVPHGDLFERLPDGFTDGLAYESGMGEDDKGVADLSGPDHNVGVATERHANNRQMGTGCWAALNTARAGCAAVVDVPDGVEVEKPISVVFAYTDADGDADGAAYHPRLFVVAGKGARVRVQQRYVDLSLRPPGAARPPRLSNGYTQVYVGAGGSVTHDYVDETGGSVVAGVESRDDALRTEEATRPGARDSHLECIDAHCRGKDSLYVATVASVGGAARSRVCLAVTMLLEGARGEINGIVLAGGTQRSEMRTVLHHIGEKTESRQKQKNMVGGRATAVFKGRIRVEQDAQLTNSEQLARTLLLSDRSRAWAVPSLEIIADDVKCAHGATISDLSEEEMFYMRSRGINALTARNLLMYAFVNEIVMGMGPGLEGSEKDGLKERIGRKLERIVPKQDRAIKGEFQSS